MLVLALKFSKDVQRPRVHRMNDALVACRGMLPQNERED